MFCVISTSTAISSAIDPCYFCHEIGNDALFEYLPGEVHGGLVELFVPEFFPTLLIAATVLLKAVGDAALVAAILPALVSVDVKLLTAMREIVGHNKS